MKSSAILPPGLVYFWCLNDDCNLDKLRGQLRGFADAKIRTVILHPRSGLLVPYLGGDWFDLIRTLVDDAAALGICCWLYDEDFCPSGSAGGMIAASRPELVARAIERTVAPADLPPGQLFLFPPGTLLWAGALPPAGSPATPRDLTDRVGMIRRHWEVSPTWDSRWYYPATPLYDCPRAGEYWPEYGIRKPELPVGWTLVAFVARPTARDEMFGAAIDSLNPEGTKAFIACTYDQYAAALGDRLGRQVPAVFTDEPKFLGGTPWTPGLFESFQARSGYDLRTRLNHLFEPSTDPVALATRLHYRDWCARRFRESWLAPIRQWCDRHHVALVGHISPEDDLVTQAICIGNLLDTYEYFDLPGLDVIIPAVGDHRHPILNIGGLGGVSMAQQLDKSTALSETLGASGLSLDPRLAGKILAWQTASGVGSLVIHAAMVSSLGLREYEAPPDFGPESPRWPGMTDVNRGLTPLLEIVRNSIQVAPVAVLWPVGSFMAEVTGWQFDDSGRRKSFNDLILALLENQIGIQVLDEPRLQVSRLDGQQLKIGRASFDQLVIPPSLVLGQATIAKLAELRRAGFPIHALGQTPAWSDDGHAFQPVTNGPWDPVAEARAAEWCQAHLPAVAPVATDRRADLRVSRWLKDGREFVLAINLGAEPLQVRLGALAETLQPGELVAYETRAGHWKAAHRFDPNQVRGELAPAPSVPCRDWAVRWPRGDWEKVAHPQAVYQLRPLWRRPEELVRMCLTGSAPIGGDPVDEQVEYRTTVSCDGPIRPAALVLAPTAIRGRGILRAGSREWAFAIADTDTKALEIDLSEAAPARGDLELVFRFDKPMPFDGIKLPPLVRGAKAV